MHLTLPHFLPALAAVFFVGAAMANPCPPGNPPSNCGPEPGAILDLAGQPIPIIYTQYATSFIAQAPATVLRFAFRHDSGFHRLDDISVSTGSGPNLVSNPGFELGPIGEHEPLNWTYRNPFGAGAGGIVSDAMPHTGSAGYFDGAAGAYDVISQAIATLPGETYAITFWLDSFSTQATFSPISSLQNNGIDLLVYAAPVPEPPTYVLALAGLGCLFLMARRERRRGLRGHGRRKLPRATGGGSVAYCASGC